MHIIRCDGFTCNILQGDKKCKEKDSMEQLRKRRKLINKMNAKRINGEVNGITKETGELLVSRMFQFAIKMHKCLIDYKAIIIPTNHKRLL